MKEILTKLQFMQIPYCKKVLMLPSMMKQCVADGKILHISKAFVELSNHQFALIELWYCEECGRFYLNQREFIETERRLDGLSSIRNKDIEQESISSSSWKQEERALIPKLEVRNSKVSDESPLKEMGYDTLKSDQERWWILSEKAIPRLGKNKVIFYLEMFLRMSRNNQQM